MNVAHPTVWSGGKKTSLFWTKPLQPGRSDFDVALRLLAKWFVFRNIPLTVFVGGFGLVVVAEAETADFWFSAESSGGDEIACFE